MLIAEDTFPQGLKPGFLIDHVAARLKLRPFKALQYVTKYASTHTVSGMTQGETLSTQKLNIGIIGAGRIGKVHAETLAFRLPEAKIVAITDVNREAAQTLAARCNIPKVAAT